TLMVLLLLAARQAGRATSATASLAVSATLLLLARPAWLSDPGFQLSYAATLGLLLGVRPATVAGGGALTPVPSVARRALRWTGAQALGSIRVSAAALAATSPLTARHFQSVTLAGLPANLVAVPLAAVCLFLAVAAAPLALVLPGGARALVALAHPLVALLDASARPAARLPGASFLIPPPAARVGALPALVAGAPRPRL